MNSYQIISQLCADLGKDRLLVQGAGGNVSWKVQGTLWVKASGTWLANAKRENIFVPVDLNHLQNGLNQDDFDITPRLIPTEVEHNLRPSIETILHALMPQKIVVHLHAINILSNLVTLSCKEKIDELLKRLNSPLIQYEFVDYFKPGPDLARAVQKSLQINPEANVLFLKNHGIVLGSESVEGVHKLLRKINQVFADQIDPMEAIEPPKTEIGSKDIGYIVFPDAQVQQLVTNPTLFDRLKSDWAIYPDHVVFLGSKAFVYLSWPDFLESKKNILDLPELIFIKDAGVFIRPDFNQAKIAQLICYYDVVSRIPSNLKLDPLDKKSVNDLLNWEAEKYRKKLMR